MEKKESGNDVISGGKWMDGWWWNLSECTTKNSMIIC